MSVELITVTLPAYLASYLVNGDASGLEPAERKQIDGYLAATGIIIRDVARDASGEACEPHFSRGLDGFMAGDYLDYIAEIA